MFDYAKISLSEGLIIIGGRPGMGVTTFTLKIAHELAKTEKTLFISYHNYEKELWKMLGLDMYDVHDLHLDDSFPFYYSEFCEHLGAFLKQEGYTTVFMDDLDSLFNEDHSDVYADQDEVIQDFKQMAETFDVRVILNVTLSNDSEKHGGDKPDLRGFTWARSIISEATQIYAIHRPFYYGIVEDEHGNSTLNQMEVLRLKDENLDSSTFHLEDWR